MALKENDLRWFRPLWRRIALAGFLCAWLAWEVFYSRDQLWMFVVGAALFYTLYVFFYAFPKDEPAALPPAEDTDPEDPPR